MRIRNIKGAEDIVKNSKYNIKIDDTDFTWKNIFGNDKPIMVEIGMGKGDFIIGMANRHPEWNFVGIEMYESVLVRAIKKLEKENLDNVKIMNIDAQTLNKYFKHEVDTIFLNFSDPWPKKRHHKRRLTYETFLKVYDEVYKGDAHIVMKTDNDGLFEDSLVYLTNYGYVLDEVILDLEASNKENVKTEYEEKFSNLGFKIKYLDARKKNIGKKTK